MTRDEIDTLWNQALQETVKAHEPFTRYRFAALVAAAQREKDAQVCEAIEWSDEAKFFAKAIRERSET
jgi:hypothetical protein